MKCPDCKKDLSVTGSENSFTFRCNFCGLNERTSAPSEKEAYEKLIEAKKSRRQLKMNVKIDQVLDDFWKRNASQMLKRACIMIEEMING